MMHILAQSAFCHRQVTGCGMPGWGWALILIVLFIIVTIGTFAGLAKTRHGQALYCTGTRTGQKGPHYHDTFAEVDRCEGTR